MLLVDRAKQEFDIEPLNEDVMSAFIERCENIYQGRPEWVDAENHIKTVNVAASICSEVAQLTTLAIGIQIDGSARAKWLQEQLDDIYFELRKWVEYGCAGGTVILKPNGQSIDVVLPQDFRITDEKNGKVTGAVFFDEQYSSDSGKWYSRVEYHRFDTNGDYLISNRCRVAKKKGDKGKPVQIENTPWKELQEETSISGIDRPLFGVLKMPKANNVDMTSTLGLPIFAGAIEELKDFDVAYSRNAYELFHSKRTVVMDSDRLVATGKKVSTSGAERDALRKDAGLPDFVRMVEGQGTGDIYHEINPTLNTEQRIKGMNNLLSQIGYKCGFSNGYFVLDAKNGHITATQVESDDRRTIQLIKDVRDKLEDAVDGVVYALNAFADLYDFAPSGKYEISYDFGDITYNYAEDKAAWWAYVVQGKIPAWKYFEKFENMSEEDAKALVAEAQPVPEIGGLFAAE